MIKQKLNQSFLFQNLEEEEEDRNILIKVMDIRNIKAGETVIQ